ncbi:hypothetical protein [Microlunatus soli]|uniref:Uncharacterized protein n=1 Tax=Microlunatus soli TaxID=630515 RepID=A0A1H1SXE9_9ACTN|nr:hypothetical protein [Microlunatus soli]SDS52675.1 hypothetical protein SAMN04489812_2176 [Microlunatus soli]
MPDGERPGVVPSAVAPSKGSKQSADTEKDKPSTTSDRGSVEHAYRAGFAEATRIQRMGGSAKPTRELKQTMTGNYLELNMEGIAPGVTGTGVLRIGVVVTALNEERGRAVLVGCEDWSRFEVVDDESGKPLWDPGSRYLIQHMVAEKGPDDRWRVADLRSTEALTKSEWKRNACVRDGNVR